MSTCVVQCTFHTNSGEKFNFTMIDLFGFDSTFTSKIINDENFSLIEQDESMTQSQVEKLVMDCNDNNMYHL